MYCCTTALLDRDGARQVEIAVGRLSGANENPRCGCIGAF